MEHSGVKIFSRQPDDIIVRARAQDEAGGVVEVSFEKSRIDYLRSCNNDMSAIVLQSGLVIPVALSHAELEARIFLHEGVAGNIIDLTIVTGGITPPEKLSPAFEKAAAPIVDVPLTITLFARQNGGQNFKMMIFNENIVKWDAVRGISNALNGDATALGLKKGHADPFGANEIVFDMPRARFMELYNLAKMKGDKTLDIRDQTRRRAPRKTPKP